jgi:hypothetical protein
LGEVLRFNETPGSSTGVLFSLKDQIISHSPVLFATLLNSTPVS